MVIFSSVDDMYQVAHALEYYGDDDTMETINFIKVFDRFFDCFNVRCISECVKKRKPDLRPYRDPCDSRLAVIKLPFNTKNFFYTTQFSFCSGLLMVS